MMGAARTHRVTTPSTTVLVREHRLGYDWSGRDFTVNLKLRIRQFCRPSFIIKILVHHRSVRIQIASYLILRKLIGSPLQLPSWWRYLNRMSFRRHSKNIKVFIKLSINNPRRRFPHFTWINFTYYIELAKQLSLLLWWRMCSRVEFL